MQYDNFSWALFFFAIAVPGCKKGKAPATTGCSSSAVIIRQISNKAAVIKLTATVNPVYMVEQGSIDTKLIPCNLPMEYFQNDLQVTVSGNVTLTPQTSTTPCCVENFIITKISR